MSNPVPENQNKELHWVNLELHIESEHSENEIEMFEMLNPEQIKDEILKYESDSDMDELDGEAEMLY